QGRLPGPRRPHDRPRRAPHHTPAAGARTRGRGARARLRAVGGPLELVPRAARDAPVHAGPPPGQVPALGGADGGVLRPRLRRLLAGADRAALVRRGERPDARRAPDDGGGRRALLETPLAPALPFTARQSVCSHALTPFGHVSNGSA